MKKKKRGRPKGSGKKKLQLAQLQPGIPAQDQPILSQPAETPEVQNPAGGTNQFSDSFESEVAGIPATVGGDDLPAAVPDGVAECGQPGPEISPALSRFAAALEPDAVRGWIGVPFDALASWMDNPEMSLEEWEREFWAPAVSACLQRYVPALLQKTNQPELAALALCASTYVIGRYKAISQTWKKPKEENPRAFDAKSPARPVGLAGVTTIPDSPALSQS